MPLALRRPWVDVGPMHTIGRPEPDISVIVSRRELLTRGAVSYLAEHRPQGVVVPVIDLARSAPAVPNGRVGLVLIDVQHDGPDRLEGCHQFGLLRTDARLGAAVMVAVLDEAPSDAVELRLVEAGASRRVLCEDLMRQPQRLAALVTDPTDPAAATGMADRLQLRGQLGLHRDGNLNALVSELRHLPAVIWVDGQSQDSLPVSRRALINARKLAQSVGGVPPPDPARFATLFRRAPLHPEWSTVRRLMGELMGMANSWPSTDSQASLAG